MRLIDADVLYIPSEEMNARMAVAYAPTVDAVPVVRCRDCKHYHDGTCLKIYDDGNYSTDAIQERSPTDFCSYGERKQEVRDERQ